MTTKNTEQGNYAYQYDEPYRLIGATNPAAPTELYTYDAVGNRLTSANVQTTFTDNANDEVLGYGDISYEYDFNGNTIRNIDHVGTTTYTYDVDNCLIPLITPNAQFLSYHCDLFGRRIWKDVSRTKTHFLYSDEGLIGQYAPSGNQIRTYGYGPDSIWSTNPSL